MNERNLKLINMINDLVNAAYQAGNNYACWRHGNSSGALNLIQSSNDKTEELKKKLCEALTIE